MQGSAVISRSALRYGARVKHTYTNEANSSYKTLWWSPPCTATALTPIPRALVKTADFQAPPTERLILAGAQDICSVAGSSQGTDSSNPDPHLEKLT